MVNIYKFFKGFFILCLVLLFFEAILFTVSFFGKGSYLRVSRVGDIDGSIQRILCLGDSFTYGLGAEKEYSYPTQLERLLNDNNSGREFKVFYYGIDGLSSSIIANTLSDNINKYRPDILIILAGCNDHWALYQSNLSKVLKGEKINDSLLRAKIFLYRFRAFRLIQLVFNEMADKIQDTKRDKSGTIKFTNITDENLNRALIEYNYKKIIQVVNSSNPGIRLFFQTYPVGVEHINKFIKTVALDYKIPIIEQDVIFSKLNEIKPFVASDGWHLNAKGYNLMAKNIYKKFLEEGIIDKRLTRDIIIPGIKEIDEIIRLDRNTWEYDLEKIAKHPEKIISQRENGWYLGANNMVDLPELKLTPGKYILQIKAKGTAAEGVYPLIGFYYKTKGMNEKSEMNELNKVYVDSEWKDYLSKEFMLNNEVNITLCISFENDACIIKNGVVNDRNLYIGKIILKAII